MEVLSGNIGRHVHVGSLLHTKNESIQMNKTDMLLYKLHRKRRYVWNHGTLTGFVTQAVQVYIYWVKQ